MNYNLDERGFSSERFLMTKLTKKQAIERLDQIVREAKNAPATPAAADTNPMPSPDAPLVEIIAWHMRNTKVPDETLDEKVARAVRLARPYLSCTP